MDIQLKDDEKIFSLTNEENNNDNYITITVQDNEWKRHVSIDINILELYSAVSSFITLKKKNEDITEHYFRINR